MNFRRIRQVLHYSWQHAGELASVGGANKSRISIYLDMLGCYMRYNMWSNQYKKEKFHTLSAEERAEKGRQYYEAGKKRDAWQREFVENRKFLIKYSNQRYELPGLREKRQKAYTERYNMGKNCFVEYDVELSRQHYLEGSITIGNNVLLAKHVFIDYSGEVTIEDGVKLTNGVIVLSHYRSNIGQKNSTNIPTKLTIRENAYIGSRAIIMASCHYIGKNARIGAGAIVTKDVPDNCVVGGVPAKVIRMLEEN